jgi:uncharacterized membrane protein YkoI
MLAILSSLAVILAAASPGGDPDKCYADWSQAAALVRQEGLVAVDELTRLARERHQSEVIKTTLCLDGDRYVYRLVIRRHHGPLHVVIVDARQPFDR